MCSLIAWTFYVKHFNNIPINSPVKECQIIEKHHGHPYAAFFRFDPHSNNKFYFSSKVLFIYNYHRPSRTDLNYFRLNEKFSFMSVKIKENKKFVALWC